MGESEFYSVEDETGEIIGMFMTESSAIEEARLDAAATGRRYLVYRSSDGIETLVYDTAEGALVTAADEDSPYFDILKGIEVRLHNTDPADFPEWPEDESGEKILPALGVVIVMEDGTVAFDGYVIEQPSEALLKSLFDDYAFEEAGQHPDAWKEGSAMKRRRVRRACHIEKRGDKYVLLSDDGKVLGEHETKEQAVEQLKAIQVNKRKGGIKRASESITETFAPGDKAFFSSNEWSGHVEVVSVREDEDGIQWATIKRNDGSTQEVPAVRLIKIAAKKRIASIEVKPVAYFMGISESEGATVYCNEYVNGVQATRFVCRFYHVVDAQDAVDRLNALIDRPFGSMSPDALEKKLAKIEWYLPVIFTPQRVELPRQVWVQDAYDIILKEIASPSVSDSGSEIQEFAIEPKSLYYTSGGSVRQSAKPFRDMMSKQAAREWGKVAEPAVGDILVESHINKSDLPDKHFYARHDFYEVVGLDAEKKKAIIRQIDKRVVPHEKSGYRSVSGIPGAYISDPIEGEVEIIGSEYVVKAGDVRALLWEGGMSLPEDMRTARVAAVQPKVGDILYTNWGYDQTNVEFFEVVDVKPASVVLRAIAKKSEPTGWLSDDVVPIPGQYISDFRLGDKPFIRRFSPSGDGYSVKIDEVRYAWLWDGKSKNETKYASSRRTADWRFANIYGDDDARVFSCWVSEDGSIEYSDAETYRLADLLDDAAYDPQLTTLPKSEWPPLKMPAGFSADDMLVIFKNTETGVMFGALKVPSGYESNIGEKFGRRKKGKRMARMRRKRVGAREYGTDSWVADAWDDPGNEFAALHDSLLDSGEIPPSGKAKTVAAEAVRLVGRLLYEAYNNGWVNDKTEEFFDLKALLPEAREDIEYLMGAAAQGDFESKYVAEIFDRLAALAVQKYRQSKEASKRIRVQRHRAGWRKNR